MKRAWIGLAVLAAVVLSSCTGFGDFGDFDRAKEDFHYSYPLQPGARLEIQNTNGSVDITGWDRNTIEIAGTKYASSEDRLREVRIRVDVTGNSASIVTETPRDFLHGSYGARYFIHVPRQISVDRGETTNGSISVEDLRGDGRLKSTNGRISMARNDGNYDVQTTNGAIEFEECSGIERAQTTNGGIHGQLRAGAINAHSTNGTVDVTIRKTADAQEIRASTINGTVMLALAELHDNPVMAQTTHGNVTLRIPADTNARLTARTSFSKIITDFPLSSMEEVSKHELRAQIGKGGPLISAVTTTGSVHIERY